MHTNGDWIVAWFAGEGNERAQFVKIEGGRNICRIANHPSIIEQEANAHLIAAAPQLLEACGAMVGWLVVLADLPQLSSIQEDIKGYIKTGQAAIAAAKP